MLYSRSLWVLIFTLVLCVSCSKHPRYKAEPAIPLTYDGTVSDDNKDLIDLDLRTLSWAKPAGKDGADILGVPEISSSALSGWLRDRAGFIVGENYNVDENLFAQQRSYTYNPVVASYLAAAGTPLTMMANLGVAIYIVGKSEKILVKAQIGTERPTVTSARVGIFQIGEGLFSQKTIGSVGDADSLASSLRRLAVFFHEARHSDGNEAAGSLGFLHATCPAGMGQYSGQAACDDTLNGAYTVGRLVLKNLYDSCDECNSEEREGLTTLIADYGTRVLGGATTKDARAERVTP